jgi:hypothetical protein
MLKIRGPSRVAARPPQEWVFVFGPQGLLMLRPRMNELGATLMPSVNTLANMLTGYVHTDPSVQVGGRGG